MYIKCIFMCDSSDTVEDLNRYYDEIIEKDLDAVLGSRFIKGGKIVDYPFIKLVFNRIGNLLAKLLLWTDLNDFTKLLQDIFKDRFAGLLHSINDETGDRTLATAGSSELIAGEDKIVEELLGLNFEISMKSFFQTNPKSAEKLYSKVIDYALENKDAIDNTVVMDLFCGTGTIGQILASRSTNAKIIGVDIVASAIKDAIKNAKRNNIDGLQFYAADVGKFINEHPEYKNKIRTIILDPSRAGIAPKTLLKIIAINADRIIYVSCNPATQARDTEEMMKHGYQIKKISLVDQFPHTSHIETVVLFEKI